MYLIYVDDYGNSGKRLDDPKQPLFMLFAVMIDVEHWADIEKDLLEVTNEICTRCGIKQEKFKLHAWEFFSQYKFKDLSFDERAAYVYRIAQIVERYDGYYFATYVKKEELINFSMAFSLFETAMSSTLEELPLTDLQGQRVIEGFLPQLRNIILDPYALAMTSLLRWEDQWLAGKGSKGMVIIDRQQEYESFHSFRTLSAMREAGQARNLIEQPLQGNGSVNVMLQITDVLGYIIGGFLKMQFYGKTFPERHTKTGTLVRKRLTLHDATTTYGSKDKPIMTMFAELLMGRMGIDIEHGRLVEEMRLTAPPATEARPGMNTAATYRTFLTKKTGEKRSSEPEPQDG